MKFSIDGAKKLLKNNWKYLAGAIAFIILVVILVNLSAKEDAKDQEKVKQQQEEQTAQETQESGTETVEPASSLSVEDYPEVNELIQKYFDSMANNDVETLKQILAEVLPEDEASVKTGSEQTESYNNIVCYTKPGNVENTYVVFASYEAKFVGINTTAPGLLSFYVITKEDGSLCIQNKLDDDVKEYIQGLVANDTEVADLFEASQKRYEQALADDADLKAFVEGLESENTETAGNQEETPEQVAEATEETQSTETAEKTEEQPQEETSEQTTETTEGTTYVKAKENVNVRNGASEEADPIGKLLGGESAEKTGEKDGWICINYKGQEGYVKADFVEATSDGSTSVSKAQTENTESESSESKETVYVKETVNIRSGMSQDSDKVGTAYAGESYTKIMDYADGWTKVEYNGSEAYIKTEFLETR